MTHQRWNDKAGWNSTSANDPTHDCQYRGLPIEQSVSLRELENREANKERQSHCQCEHNDLIDPNDSLKVLAFNASGFKLDASRTVGVVLLIAHSWLLCEWYRRIMRAVIEELHSMLQLPIHTAWRDLVPLKSCDCSDDFSIPEPIQAFHLVNSPETVEAFRSDPRECS